jgi:hypothetical protein
MLIGTLVGTYSSIFVAAPILTVIKGRTEKVRTIEERRRIREAKGAVPNAAAETIGTAPASAAPAASATSTGGGPKPGRPRPTSKRRPPAKRKRR